MGDSVGSFERNPNREVNHAWQFATRHRGRERGGQHPRLQLAHQTGIHSRSAVPVFSRFDAGAQGNGRHRMRRQADHQQAQG